MIIIIETLYNYYAFVIVVTAINSLNSPFLCQHHQPKKQKVCNRCDSKEPRREAYALDTVRWTYPRKLTPILSPKAGNGL